MATLVGEVVHSLISYLAMIQSVFDISCLPQVCLDKCLDIMSHSQKQSICPDYLSRLCVLIDHPLQSDYIGVSAGLEVLKSIELLKRSCEVLTLSYMFSCLLCVAVMYININIKLY